MNKLLIFIGIITLVLSGCANTETTQVQEKQVEETVAEDTKTLTFEITDDWERFPNNYFSAMYGKYIEYDFGVPIKKFSLRNDGPGTDEDVKNENSRMLKYYLEEWKVEDSSSGSFVADDINVYYFSYLDPNFDLWESQIRFAKEGNIYQISMSDKAENHKELLEKIVSTLKLE